MLLAAGSRYSLHAQESEVSLVDEGIQLRHQLRSAGYSGLAIDAAWPEWWGTEASTSLSAVTELKLTVARRLGITPSSLFGDQGPTFSWADSARFKNLGTTSLREQGILSSFGVSLAGLLTRGAPEATVDVPENIGAAWFRERLEELGGYTLRHLVALCWAVGIPVVQTHVFPLPQKRMHAVTASVRGRSAIILGESTFYPAKAAFTIAHELGHVFLGHTTGAPTFIDVADPVSEDLDAEESAANTFALRLLTGRAEFEIRAGEAAYTAPQLADAAMSASAASGIDAGLIVLMLARQVDDWPRAIAALNLLGREPVAQRINQLARTMLRMDAFNADEIAYLENVLTGRSTSA